MLNRSHVLFLAVLLLISPAKGQTARKGYHPEVKVSADTRLDWTFTLANQSLVQAPADWTPDYQAKEQSYELFVPPNYNPKRPHPLIVFVSPGNRASGWKAWKQICEKEGILFAGTHNAGNNSDMRKRLRIVLDVLDDVRRSYHIDPDRTYLSGFSGGARAACAIAFALPECFGGVVPICAGGELRDETWLRHRVRDRLSIALVTGEKDFNRGEVERFKGPMWKEIGIRTRVWIPATGHTLPPADTLAEVYNWLEEGRKTRADLAKRDPSSRYPPDQSLTREAWAAAMLAEGKKRMADKGTFYSGLMLLQGAMDRWPDLPPSQEARNILLKIQDGPDRSWELEDIAEQRILLVARARALDAYASGPLPKQYDRMRPDMIRQAIALWQTILQDGQDKEAVTQARERLPVLLNLAKEK